MAVLIDASIFCAFANRRDIHHEKAKRILEEIISERYGTPLTTDYIVDETLTVIQRKSCHEEAVRFGKHLFNSEITVLQLSQAIFQEAWKIFQRQKGLSFTDCTLVASMESLGIQKIATFDKAFKNIDKIEAIDS
ncbi:hypothetical protein CMO92_03100 [Candidatus Woesearchaeota archaeon]|nr:hypothetical protein [Candidatus Woesearchaeota archaeon]|tara:strand:- start:1228 stop:1632 length:405 start_codon:yes stop_codon:yes gene_type:complete